MKKRTNSTKKARSAAGGRAQAAARRQAAQAAQEHALAAVIRKVTDEAGNLASGHLGCPGAGLLAYMDEQGRLYFATPSDGWHLHRLRAVGVGGPGRRPLASMRTGPRFVVQALAENPGALLQTTTGHVLNLDNEERLFLASVLLAGLNAQARGGGR